MDKKISFTEELLSGYLDGELADEDAIKVHNFATSSVDLKEDLLSLSKIGEVFSSSFQKAPSDLNTWQAIQSRLPHRQPSPIESKIKRQVKEEPTESSGFWSSIFQPRFAAALAFGLVVVGMFSSQWVELPSKKVEVASTKITESDIPLEKNEILVPLLPKSTNVSAQTFVSNGNTSGQKNDFNYSPQFISPQQLGAEHPARGTGVRADGMQVEWMRNSRAVRFLRHDDDSLPPTIWLGELK